MKTMMKQSVDMHFFFSFFVPKIIQRVKGIVNGISRSGWDPNARRVFP